MNMYKYCFLIIMWATLLMPLKTMAQQERGIAFIGNPGFEKHPLIPNDELLIFDSLRSVTNTYPLALDGREYQFYVIFKIDTFSKVVDFKLVELSICEVPLFIKSCIEQLVHATNGLWLPQIKNGQKVTSDEMIWRVEVYKKDQSIEERLKAGDKFFEFNLDYTKTDEIVRRFDQTRKWRRIVLPY